MIFGFFATCRGAGFLFSSCIYSTEERKTDPWSSYLHNAQKHLSQDSCWWIEASGDTAVDHLPLIILNSFSVNRSSEWGCLRRQRKERIWSAKTYSYYYLKWMIGYMMLSHTNTQKWALPQDQQMPCSIWYQFFANTDLIKVYGNLISILQLRKMHSSFFC